MLSILHNGYTISSGVIMTVVNGPLRSWVESFGASKEKHHQICSNFSSIKGVLINIFSCYKEG